MADRLSDKTVTELEVETTGLIASCYEEPDYRDRFAVAIEPDQYRSVDEVVSDWFSKQPTWILALSANTLSRTRVDAAIEEGGYAVGDSIGSWKVIARNDSEIVFGDNMGFMEYRYSFRLIDGSPGSVEGATAVKFLWRRTGRFYFALVRPLHRRFIKTLLRKTVS